MSKPFKSILGRFLSDDESKQQSHDFKTTMGFYPTDSNYDPQTRLKRRLKAFFPHMPIGGLPPSAEHEQDDEA